jgi:hypothetical protein
MPKLKPGHLSPTTEEDALISLGIADDPDNPEVDDDWFAGARPASEVLPELFGPEVAAEMLKPRGRPKLDNPKKRINIRLSAEVLDYFKSTGRGWQTRMNDALIQFIHERPHR